MLSFGEKALAFGSLLAITYLRLRQTGKSSWAYGRGDRVVPADKYIKIGAIAFVAIGAGAIALSRLT